MTNFHSRPCFLWRHNRPTRCMADWIQGPLLYAISAKSRDTRGLMNQLAGRRSVMMRGARFEVRFVLRIADSQHTTPLLHWCVIYYQEVFQGLWLLVSEKLSIGFICFKSSAVFFKVLPWEQINESLKFHVLLPEFQI